MPAQKISPDAESSQMEPKQQLFGGIFVRRYAWRVSWKGWLLGLFILTLLPFIIRSTAYSFLAANQPIGGEILIVEGWVPAYAVNAAATLFKAGRYEKILTSGGQAKGQWSEKYKITYAEIAAEYLGNAGVPSSKIQAVPCEDARKDRTYASALAVAKWLEINKPGISKVDVLTLGPHSRRSRMLFRKALGDKFNVGIISIPDREYDFTHWWQTSEGVRDVVGEAIAYVYAGVFFHPSHATEHARSDDNRLTDELAFVQAANHAHLQRF